MHKSKVCMTPPLTASMSSLVGNKQVVVSLTHTKERWCTPLGLDEAIELMLLVNNN